MSDILANPKEIPNSTYPYMFSLLNSEDGLAHIPNTCKETATNYLGSALAFRHQIHNYSPFYDGFPNTERPRHITWWHHKYPDKRGAKARTRVFETLDMLHGHLGLSAPRVWNLKDTRGIVMEVDPWFLKSSLTNYLLLTFVRSALSRPINGKVNTTNINAYIQDVIDTDKDRKEKNETLGLTYDFVHFQKSLKNENLTRLLEKKHVVLTRNGFDDWLVARPATNKMPRWQGLCSYVLMDSDTPENYNLISLDAIFRAGYAQTNPSRYASPGVGYSVWRKLGYL